MMRALTVAAIAAAALGCSDMPSQPPSDADITGTWQWVSPGNPNNPAGPRTVTLHLTSIGGAITGSGSNSWIGGPVPLTITGTMAGNDVDLEMASSSEPTMTFHGHLILRRILSGVEQIDPAGSYGSIAYQRLD